MNRFILLYLLLCCNGQDGCRHSHEKKSDCCPCKKPVSYKDEDDCKEKPDWLRSHYRNGDSCGCDD